jgi:hypothetical protein
LTREHDSRFCLKNALYALFLRRFYRKGTKPLILFKIPVFVSLRLFG